MRMLSYPVPDLPQTGARIAQLLRERGLTPRMVQAWLGLESPRAVYKWLNGRCLPTVDHLLALSRLMEVPMEALLVWHDLPAEDVASRDVPGKPFLLLRVYHTRRRAGCQGTGGTRGGAYSRPGPHRLLSAGWEAAEGGAAWTCAC